MRRRVDDLIPIELAILGVVATSADPVHGFAIARLLADGGGAHRLTAHGTLYKALGRLAERGLLAASWEDADVALAEGRPRRRLYTVTAAGSTRLAAVASAAPPTAVPRLA